MAGKLPRNQTFILREVKNRIFLCIFCIMLYLKPYLVQSSRFLKLAISELTVPPRTFLGLQYWYRNFTEESTKQWIRTIYYFITCKFTFSFRSRQKFQFKMLCRLQVIRITEISLYSRLRFLLYSFRNSKYSFICFVKLVTLSLRYKFHSFCVRIRNRGSKATLRKQRNLSELKNWMLCTLILFESII